MQEDGALLELLRSSLATEEPAFEVRRSDDAKKGVHVVAKRNLAAEDLVLVEEPLYVLPPYSESFLRRPDAASLFLRLQHFSKTHGHLEGAAKFPPRRGRF